MDLYIVLIGLVLQMLFRPPENVRTQIETELFATSTYLTTSDFQHIEHQINGRFQSWVHETNFYPVIEEALKPEKQKGYAQHWQEEASLGLLSDKWLFRLLENLQLFAYQLVHRITLLEFWTFTMLPMMIAVIMTGYYQWRIKLYQLGGSSTGHVRVYLKLMWLLLFLFSVYLITPNLFGGYTMYAPPTLLLVVAISISLVFTNFSKAT